MLGFGEADQSFLWHTGQLRNASIRPSLVFLWSGGRMGLSISGSLHSGGPRSASFFALDELIEKRSPAWSSTKVESERENFEITEMK